MEIYLAGGQTGGNIPVKERHHILMLASQGGGGPDLNEDVPGEPSYADKVLMGEKQCDCSLLGSPRGGAGGGTTL